MFEFLGMMGNYEQRKVGNTDYAHGFVSTAKVNDGFRPFETAVQDSRYEGPQSMAIVEAYDTREAAAKGHERWSGLMTSEKPPEELTDCANSDIGKLAAMVSAGRWVWRLKTPVPVLGQAKEKTCASS